MEIEYNSFKNTDKADTLMTQFNSELLITVNNFHKSVPGYESTPLHQLKSLADQTGVANIYVKDESSRFSLNAFKGLGSIYAMAAYFNDTFGFSNEDFDRLLHQVKEIEPLNFITATDGNHGKGLAWAASLFGQHAKVYMPKNTSDARLNAIRDFGAEAEITDLNYDDTVGMAAELAEKNGYILVQDTAWDGYEDIPLRIMQGYTTMISEIKEALGKDKFNDITHVFLQAGVGSFAGSMAAALINSMASDNLKIIVVEPDQAACLYDSARYPSGEPQRVEGDMNTMMAGLACGEPSIQGWPILKDNTDVFLVCEDAISAKGMRILGQPLEGDTQIVSGESGAAPVGAFHELMTDEKYSELKDKLKLDNDSGVLFINTEGDTDPDNYARVMNGEIY